MNISNIHAVVICSNEERRAHMETQCAAFPWKTSFFTAYTPATSAAYLNYKDITYPERNEVLCCTRSHFAALDHGLRVSDKGLLLILEDDVSFLRHGCLEELQTVLDEWSAKTAEIDYVSLGYIPCEEVRAISRTGRRLYSSPGLSSVVWGTQAYLVPRTVAEEMVAFLHQPTARLTHDGLFERIRTRPSGGTYAHKYPRLQSDVALSVGWRQAVAHPMLVIEYPFTSLITPGDPNLLKRWDKVCADGTRSADDFLGMEVYLAAMRR
jgi:hypothetical protein